VEHVIPVKRPRPRFVNFAGLPFDICSGLQCDGAEPCGACRNNKRKSRICEYSEKARKIAAGRREREQKMLRTHETGIEPQTPEYIVPNQKSSTIRLEHHGETATNMSLHMHNKIALSRVVNEVNHRFCKIKHLINDLVHRCQAGQRGHAAASVSNKKSLVRSPEMHVKEQCLASCHST